jgi:hypothetical protein
MESFYQGGQAPLSKRASYFKFGFIGSEIVKVEPLPGSLSTSIFQL